MIKPYKPNCDIKPGMVVPDGIRRVALTVEYNGMAFKGFQKQASAQNTVQAALESALSNIANETITLVCAGRTDAGVHASQQVVHFDTSADRPKKAWLDGVNTQLPDGVRVVGVFPVTLAFHARFGATARTYRYVLSCTPSRPAILADLTSWVKYNLDVEPMRLGAEYLVGEHDFTSFRAAHCQAQQPVRTVHHARFYEQGDLLIFEIKANAFLYHMVRNIMGTLFDVGRGVKQPEWIRELLVLKNRSLAAPTAPPQGLYFVAAEYDPVFGVPSKALGPPFLNIQ